MTAGDQGSRRLLPWAATWPILILAFCNICSFADRQVTSILAAPIRQTLGLDHAHMALLGGTAFAALYGIAGIPAGLAADRFPRRFLICGAVAFWSVCTAVCGYATSFETLFLARLGVGVGEAVLLPCAFSLIRDLVTVESRGYAFAVFGTGIPAGAGLGLIAGGVLNTFFTHNPASLGFLGALHPWQKTFVILAGLGVPAALSALALPEPARGHAALAAPAAPLHRPPSLAASALFFVAIALTGMMVQGQNFWTPSLMMERFHLNTAAVGTTLGLITIVFATLGMFILGAISDRATARHGTAGAATTLAATLLAFGLGGLMVGLAPGGASWVGVALFSFLGIGFTSVASALAIRVGPEARAGLMGAIYGLVVNVAGHGLGPLTYGWLQDRPGLSHGAALALATGVLAPLAALAALGVALLTRAKSARLVAEAV